MARKSYKRATSRKRTGSGNVYKSKYLKKRSSKRSTKRRSSKKRLTSYQRHVKDFMRKHKKSGKKSKNLMKLAAKSWKKSKRSRK